MLVKKSTPFADLVPADKVGEVTLKFEELILRSFAEEVARTRLTIVRPRTAAEVKRRFNILADWFKVLRGDIGWSLQRVLDELPMALRKTLDGEQYVPDVRRSAWMP